MAFFANFGEKVRQLLPSKEREHVPMSEVRVYDCECPIRQKRYYCRLKWTVWRSESTGAGNDGQSEPIVKSGYGLHNVTIRCRFYSTEL